MSATLNPAISLMDESGLCYSIYVTLYHNFLNSQDAGTVVEGDDISIRLKNTAYQFADAISTSIAGGGGTGGTDGYLIDYLKKSGGDLTGLVRANNGFEAGIDNTKVVAVYNNDGTYGIQVDGELNVNGQSFKLGGVQVLSYDSVNDIVSVSGKTIDFRSSSLLSSGEVTFGDKETGVYISPTLLSIAGNGVFHAGNANRETVDWAMQNGTVSGTLDVNGITTLSKKLNALYGADIGYDGVAVISVSKNSANLSGNLSFSSGFGIVMNALPVLMRVGTEDVQLGAIGGNIYLGNDKTLQVRLYSGIYDVTGTNEIVSKTGAGYFPASLKVKHNQGADLLSTYRVDSADEGITIHKKLRFGSSTGSFLHGDSVGIGFTSFISRKDPNNQVVTTNTHDTLFKYQASTSLYKNLSSNSDSLLFSTDSDFFTFNHPVEALGHIGVDGSLTRLTDGYLFLSNDSYLHCVTGGIRHSGSAFFEGNISSSVFSSGMAGSGWGITLSKTTGNYIGSFDEMYVRKRLHVYDFEVKKVSATNGSLWVTDSFSGDIVTKL